MAFTYRSSTTAGNASGGAVTVNKPAGTVDGDLIIIVAYLETDTNVWDSVGAGFTRISETPSCSGELTVQMWWKWASGEPASWTWTPHTSAWRSVVGTSYSGGGGAGAAGDVHSSNSGLAQLEANQTAPSVTTTVNNDILAFGYGSFGGFDATSCTGGASNQRVTFGGTLIADANFATAGATGTTHPNGQGTQDFGAIHSAFFLSPTVTAPTIIPDYSLFPKAIMRTGAHT